MNEKQRIGGWIRRFLMEYLVGERNLARNTQASYRDTLALLLPFTAQRVRQPVDHLDVEDISADVVRSFLQHIEQKRSCSIVTRNQRLAAIHALARFIGERCPEYIAWCSEIRAVPFKKTPKPTMTYLEKPEMDALLNAPDCSTRQGQRDYALILFLYNSGARADEAARLTVGDLELGRSPSVKINGKGGKTRYCPLWTLTAGVLAPLIAERVSHEVVFLNRRKQPLTRFGIRTLVKRNVLKAAWQEPSLLTKQVSVHTIRHTTGVHLLRAGVDINTIRAWLGHVSLNTTNVYAEVDLEMKAKALAHCEIPVSEQHSKPWHDYPGVMSFLRAL
ncbi:MAG: Tyrosine recombinase XerC [Dehalococcoidia bacterium]|nr:Tyrosine recombinase XerC [Bacillota bacterium]MBT9160734.1 Tyrosine recombinase XerC [Chloroflexota bacterium]MBT9162528.1 Tyrosine recombinase XerC [Chloroflexota bacterium]